MGQVRDVVMVAENGTSFTKSTPNIEGRLGALYSLERILLESKKDQRTILETLCAYVRENSPVEVPEDEAEVPKFRRSPPPSPTRRADVQAALTIIGRRPENVRTRAENEGWRLDFRNSNLIAYDFSALNFDRADFSNSFLNAANMTRGSFAHCMLSRTFLRATQMNNASFDSSIFDGCDVERARIEDTSFRSAKFIDTDLRNANVMSFGIEGANLDDAFGGGLKYTIELIRKEGANPYNVTEVARIYSLFQKATYDKETSVAQEVRDAIELMSQPAGAPRTSPLAPVHWQE